MTAAALPDDTSRLPILAVDSDKPRPVFVLRLRPLKNVDGVRALRRLLKYALRACGLRCVSVEESAS